MIADHDEIESSIAALLLGAIDGEEEDALREHLAGCSRCQAAAARLQRAIGELPIAADALQPPQGLRARILAAASAARPQSIAPASRPPVRRLPRPAPGRWRWPDGWTGRVTFPAAAAAALLVALALGLGVGLGLGRSGAPQPPSPVAQFTLKGSGAGSSAEGRVYEVKQAGLTLVQFTALAQPDAGKVYQLWLIPDQGNPISAGVFTPDSSGGHVTVLARDLAGLKAMAVTQENAPDGAPAPTQQPEISGSV